MCRDGHEGGAAHEHLAHPCAHDLNRPAPPRRARSSAPHPNTNPHVTTSSTSCPDPPRSHPLNQTQRELGYSVALPCWFTHPPMHLPASALPGWLRRTVQDA